jgi:hypothetical protein
MRLRILAGEMVSKIGKGREGSICGVEMRKSFVVFRNNISTELNAVINRFQTPSLLLIN